MNLPGLDVQRKFLDDRLRRIDSVVSEKDKGTVQQWKFDREKSFRNEETKDISIWLCN